MPVFSLNTGCFNLNNTYSSIHIYLAICLTLFLAQESWLAAYTDFILGYHKRH